VAGSFAASGSDGIDHDVYTSWASRSFPTSACNLRAKGALIGKHPTPWHG